MNPYPTRSNLPVRRYYGTGNPTRDLVALYSFRVVIFFLAHIPLALAMKRSSMISTAHALATLGLGLVWLSESNRRPERMIYLVAYIAGAELLWRGTGAFVLWETGKYAVTGFLLLYLMKFSTPLRGTRAPLVYFVPLLLSILVLPTLDRQELSFNLSGPLSLALATIVLSKVRLSWSQMKRVLIALIGPVVGLAFLATFSTLSAGPIAFGGSSRITSGGIGSNQVSTILGLGMLAAFLFMVSERKQRFLRLVMVFCMIWFGAQAMLTFSRGGFWGGLGPILVAALFVFRDHRSRAIFLGMAIVVSLLGVFVVFPALNNYTRGSLAVRFQDTDVTGRDDASRADLFAFRENPVFGVGPGRSKSYHLLLQGKALSAHTEYTRLLAEHGSFGVLAILVLLVLSARRLFMKVPPLEKAFSLSLTAWALLYMVHAAMRLVAPSVAFGLAAVTIIPDSEDEA